MGKFYITKVVAKGSGKTDSVIDLRPGLNIIRGRSNTGKTCIIKCIDFCFGSKAKPFDESLGYDTIEISLHTGKGDITITRALGKNQVDVVTDVPGFESGKYDLKHTNKKDPLPILSDLLLDSIGIEGEHFVIKNKNFEKKRLTWRTFLASTGGMSQKASSTVTSTDVVGFGAEISSVGSFDAKMKKRFLF